MRVCWAACVALLTCGIAGAADDVASPGRIEYRRASSTWIMNADGTAQRRARLGSYAWWSQDGKHVAFASGRSPNVLYVANGNGTHRKQVARQVGGDACFEPAWSPRAVFLAFTTDCDIDFKDLFVVRRDGTHRRQLVPRVYWPLSPKWSPNGRELLFGGAPGATHPAYRLYVTNAAGRKPERVSPLAFAYAYYVDWEWSHDGKSVYLAADRNDANREFELYAIDRRAGATRQLSPPDMNVRAIELAPDGSRMALQGSIGTRDWEIYVINADGSGLKQLTDNRVFEDSGPHWSRDGNHILFTSDRDGNYEVYLMNADGSDQRNLTQNKADDYDPSWIPKR